MGVVTLKSSYEVPTKWLAAVALCAFGSVVAMGISLYLLTTSTHHFQRVIRNDLCGALTAIIAPGQSPPTTEHGRIVNEKLRDAHRRIGC